MIDILLKHIIYEKCIDVFFNNVSSNFKIISRKFKAGDVFKELIFSYNSEYNEVFYKIFNGKIYQILRGSKLIIDFEKMYYYVKADKEMVKKYFLNFYPIEFDLVAHAGEKYIRKPWKSYNSVCISITEIESYKL